MCIRARRFVFADGWWGVMLPAATIKTGRCAVSLFFFAEQSMNTIKKHPHPYLKPPGAS